MKQTTIPMKSDAALIVRAGDDLFIEGSDQAQLVAIVEDGETFRLKEDEKGILVKTDSETKLTIPREVSLTIETAGSDVAMMNLNGKLVIRKIGGELTAQHVSGIAADSVGGDCYFKEVAGNVEIDRVGGDLDGFDAGSVKVHSVGGDVELSAIRGAVDVRAGGDVRLHFAVAEIAESHVDAGGDITLRVRENARATLNMTSGSESISVKAGGQQLETESERCSLPLGEGGAAIELTAGGEVIVEDGENPASEFTFVFDDLGKSWYDFGREIEEKIRHSMKGVNHSLKHAGWQASGAMQRAAEKLQGYAGSGEFGKESRVYGFSFDNKEKPEKPSEKKGMSDEERMMVLKMLQEKKISVEEAEKLLQALDK